MSREHYSPDVEYFAFIQFNLVLLDQSIVLVADSEVRQDILVSCL